MVKIPNLVKVVNSTLMNGFGIKSIFLGWSLVCTFRITRARTSAETKIQNRLNWKRKESITVNHTFIYLKMAVSRKLTHISRFFYTLILLKELFYKICSLLKEDLKISHKTMSDQRFFIFCTLHRQETFTK